MIDLQRYVALKAKLADILRSATMNGLDRDAPSMRDLFARLAEDRFNIVVAGRFSRGKSTLMNAMLGMDRLPTGIVPVTSVITTVSYGSDEIVVLHYQNSSLFLEIPLGELADHVTEQGNPGNARRIRVADVQLPAELLRRGFHFIDTPGLGSSIVENTRTTQAFLPEADAVIVVTSHDSPLSQEERDLLRRIHLSRRPGFLVVNKQDRVSPSDRATVLAHVTRQVADIAPDTPLPVFSISAQQALDARLHENPSQFAESGLPVFEAALIDFLIRSKRREFLNGMTERIESVVRGSPAVGEIYARLAAVRAEIDGASPAVPSEAEGAGNENLVPANIPPCEICAGVARAVFDLLAELQYRLSGDRDSQTRFAESHGLCDIHTWQFETMVAPREICTGFAGIAEQQADCLRAIAREGDLASPLPEALRKILPSTGACPACAAARQTAGSIGAALGDRLRRRRAALRELSAICLPHLPGLIASLADSELGVAVVQRQAALLERVAEDMRQFAMKRDALQRHLTTKEEIAAGGRALHILVGDPRGITAGS